MRVKSHRRGGRGLRRHEIADNNRGDYPVAEEYRRRPTCEERSEVRDDRHDLREISCLCEYARDAGDESCDERDDKPDDTENKTVIPSARAIPPRKDSDGNGSKYHVADV